MSMSDVNISDVVAAGFRSVRSGRIKAVKGEVQRCCAVDARKLSLSLEAGAQAHLVLLHTKPGESSVELLLDENASLDVTHLFLCSAFSNVNVRQRSGSRCRFTVAELGSANAAYTVALDEGSAEWRFDGVFVGTKDDRCFMAVNTRHNAPDCKSESMVKGVVSGRASGEFHGLVYVAPGANRTDARQQSRNLEIGGDAHVVTCPQLEIYADDVKCTHGATVGHSDEEALLYMRQRGLDEKSARRLQTEGFVKDVISRCQDEALRSAVEMAVDEKLMEL